MERSVGALSGKRALVTGGASGIGRALVKRFAQEGADVAILDVDDVGAAETGEQAKQNGGHVSVLTCDVSDSQQVSDAVDRIVSQFGGLDIAVANAAIMDRAPLLDTSPEVFDKIISVNLRGAFLITASTARVMKPGSVILHVTSVEDDRGVATSGVPYTVSKGGQRALVAAAAVHLAEVGIRVVGLAPGMVPSGLNDHNPKGEVRSIPSGRLGTTEDMASAATFLVSDQASYINGSSLYVDGAWLANLV